MKIICLKSNPDQYSCRSYLILGNWNQLDAINTLIDPGVDEFVVNEISDLPTGIGKKPVDQIIWTHNHFDHCSGTKTVKEKYGCKVRAFSPMEPVDDSLYDGQMIYCGDSTLEVIHTPGHSSDSICLYCEKHEVLFSGDTPLFIRSPGGTYEKGFVDVLERISKLRISIVYPGHGEPVTGNIGAMIANSLRNIYKSHIINPDILTRIISC